MLAMPIERTDYEQGKIDGLVLVKDFINKEFDENNIIESMERIENFIISECNKIDEY